ncbi:uncharacterized protein HMPREF1541_00020 [Cyphellophora europaea CBS 101466]|uniref:JmjC domain-containing protein n=1 Tax=Cyphellophora europaea (strain CBS 101466) TaxID=1220924 RepID=W2SD50_CYPE1|nr:uncharacterized protein HMPREF1541_00020 [Cyphellophora europaea CBS 101466]ETN45839.1 hypothetical protein HMPREF1541_00020 [Cyphellophora europaea CBS 101466]
MRDDSDLIERLVRAALRGDLHVPDISHFLTKEPEVPELVQPLKDFYAAIATFVDNVNCSRASTTVEEGGSSTSSGAGGDQTQTQPSPKSNGCSTSCPIAHIETAFQKDDKVVTLLPKNKQQCRDLPFLMSQASALGASDAGVFKYVLSDDIDIKVSVGQAASSSSFSLSYDDAAGGFRVTYHQTDDPIKVKPTTGGETRPEILATQLEGTEEQRRVCGLPLQSPIYPLPHNKLDDTLYEINGLHSPYAYLSNDHGGIFLIHTEDGYLWSLNVLYLGEVLWTTIDPKDAALVEKL